jgi:cytoskeletal protein CcmA (bactofilin family)
MELADEADALRKRGQQSRSMQLYLSALAEEEEAVRLSIEGGAGVNTLSVLHRSAASLAIDCQDWEKARNLIQHGLRIDPPGSVEEELRGLLERLSPVMRSAFDSNAAGVEANNSLQSDVEIKGSLRADSDLFFNGKLEGEIIVQGVLTVGESAYIDGEVRAQSVNLVGRIHGSVTVVKFCRIYSSAQLIGDLRATRLIIEEGATFVGGSQVSAATIATSTSSARMILT